MKRIVKNSDNQLIFTLTEKVCYVSPFYAIGIYDEQNDDWSYLLLGSSVTDQSTNQKRYNEFTLNEPNDVELDPGFYSYVVWEIPTAILPNDLGPDRIEGRLEDGRITVIGNSSAESTYTNNPDEKTYSNA